jgi:hypothetical protein
MIIGCKFGKLKIYAESENVCVINYADMTVKVELNEHINEIIDVLKWNALRNDWANVEISMNYLKYGR